MGPVRQIQAGVVGYIDEGPPDGQAVVLLHPLGGVSSGVHGRLVERLIAKRPPEDPAKYRHLVGRPQGLGTAEGQAPQAVAARLAGAVAAAGVRWRGSRWVAAPSRRTEWSVPAPAALGDVVPIDQPRDAAERPCWRERVEQFDRLAPHVAGPPAGSVGVRADGRSPNVGRSAQVVGRAVVVGSFHGASVPSRPCRSLDVHLQLRHVGEDTHADHVAWSIGRGCGLRRDAGRLAVPPTSTLGRRHPCPVQPGFRAGYRVPPGEYRAHHAARPAA
jgi:hypothetical protein